ncbi:sensor histidine kinase [Cohnella boryungensis]|uniref:Sensor histidine kinase n=2 Tax=Cohnella boryungensis TaxID=768479 RepID=A0ABV8SIG1_9BACL
MKAISGGTGTPMWNKFRNIQTILFSTYSLIIIVVFTILVLWFYTWTSDLLRKNATDSLENNGKSMQEQIESEIRKMNDVSLNVMYSNLVKNRFKQYLSDIDNGASEPVDPAIPQASEPLESAKELAEILTAAIGPSRPVEQLYLYDFKNKVYGNGFDNRERYYDPKKKFWYDEVVSSDATKIITPPVIDEEMSKYISSRDKQYSMSLFRLFYDTYNVPIGIVEVKQYYNRIMRSVLDYKRDNPDQESVLVYTDAGEILYPLEANAEDYEAYIQYAGERRGSEAPDRFTSAFTNPLTGHKELLSYHHSSFTGWNTVLIVSENKLLSPLFRFARTTVLVALFILLFAIALSYVAAKRITYPILKIHRAIRNIRLDDLGSGRVATQELNSGLNELDQLHGSFLQMSARLRQSMDELLLSQSQELQSKLVALQTQMNPHFLYNTLATISAMAEEKMNEEIVAMSENMSDILRYISSDQPLVPLETELLYTAKYLEVNGLRHRSKLMYEFEIAERLKRLQVPKLIVQPLVENALKFGTLEKPPWRIRIKADVADHRWRISVSDNGPGFSEDSLARLDQKIRELGRSNEMPVLQLGGMGLLNIYIRLKLTYGDSARFELANSPEGGAVITIGGKLSNKEE